MKSSHNTRIQRPTITGRGPVEAEALYPLNSFMRRLGIGRHSLTAMRRKGLPVRLIGTRMFIDGREALDFLRRYWADEERQQGIQKPAEFPESQEPVS